MSSLGTSPLLGAAQSLRAATEMLASASSAGDEKALPPNGVAAAAAPAVVAAAAAGGPAMDLATAAAAAERCPAHSGQRERAAARRHARPRTGPDAREAPGAPNDGTHRRIRARVHACADQLIVTAPCGCGVRFRRPI